MAKIADTSIHQHTSTSVLQRTHSTTYRKASITTEKKNGDYLGQIITSLSLYYLIMSWDCAGEHRKAIHYMFCCVTKPE